MPFEDIFNKHKKVNMSDSLGLIIVDFREKNSLVVCELVNLGVQVRFEQLSVGDYIVGKTIVERKTFSDLISSMIDKRLSSQLSSLKEQDNKLLIVEKNENSTNFSSRIHPNAIRGLFLSSVLDYGVPIIFSQSASDTANFLLLLLKRLSKNYKTSSFRPHTSKLSDNDRLKFILEGFPSIGPVKAKALLQCFGSIKSIVNASDIELEKVLGKNYKNFSELINKEYNDN